MFSERRVQEEELQEAEQVRVAHVLDQGSTAEVGLLDWAVMDACSNTLQEPVGEEFTDAQLLPFKRRADGEDVRSATMACWDISARVLNGA